MGNAVSPRAGKDQEAVEPSKLQSKLQDSSNDELIKSVTNVFLGLTKVNPIDRNKFKPTVSLKLNEEEDKLNILLRPLSIKLNWVAPEREGKTVLRFGTFSYETEQLPSSSSLSSGVATVSESLSPYLSPIEKTYLESLKQRKTSIEKKRLEMREKVERDNQNIKLKADLESYVVQLEDVEKQETLLNESAYNREKQYKEFLTKAVEKQLANETAIQDNVKLLAATSDASIKAQITTILTSLYNESDTIKKEKEFFENKIKEAESSAPNASLAKQLYDAAVSRIQNLNNARINERKILVYHWVPNFDKENFETLEGQLRNAVCVALRFGLVTFFSTESLFLKNATNVTSVNSNGSFGVTGVKLGTEVVQSFSFDTTFIKSLISTVLTTVLPANLDEIMFLRQIAREKCLRLVQEKLSNLEAMNSLSSKTAARFVPVFRNVPGKSLLYSFLVSELAALLQTIQTVDYIVKPGDAISEANLQLGFGMIAVQNLLEVVKRYQKQDEVYARNLETYMLIQGVVKNFKQDWDVVSIIEDGTEAAGATGRMKKPIAEEQDSDGNE
jgi:hypothetical protein